jgi:hypothetical protein
MHILGMTISFCSLLLGGTLVLRAKANGVFRVFPLFYSYVVYSFFATLAIYLVYWVSPHTYARAFWINYLINALAEFAVLIEISDHIFKPFALLRHLGRATTLLITACLGALYILPAIIWSTHQSLALLGFALRASVTKAIILIVLFYLARHFGSELGRNVAGLMLGFSIYVATTVAIMSSAQAFGPAVFARLFWFMEPLAYLMCLLVWIISLWELATVPSLRAISLASSGDSASVTVQLNRFSSELSKFLDK